MQLWKDFGAIACLTQTLQVLREASIELPKAGSAELWASAVAASAQRARTGFGFKLTAQEQAECDMVVRTLDSIAARLVQDAFNPVDKWDFRILAEQVVSVLDSIAPNWHTQDATAQHYASVRRMYWDD